MDIIEVRRALEIFKPEGELVEIRAIGTKKKGDIWSGYFTNHEKIIEAIKKFDSGYNLYFIFNKIKMLCYSMQQKDQMMYGVDSTNDKHIDSREWILIDFDPERDGAKISSTNEEKQYARIVANKVRNYLRDMGFNYPVVCDSGNGFHLLYKIDSWACTDENNELVSNFLNSLSMMFSDEKIGIDVKVGNNSRITKLYGSVAQKGSNTKSRPHRMSKILVVPSEIKPTDKAYFVKVAEKLPKVEKPTYENRYGQDKFDIDNFLSKHGIQVARDITDSMGMRKIILQECPFDSSHKAPDSAIFVSRDGAIGFTCFHSHCSQYTWKDVRLHYEPDAYSRKEYSEYVTKSRKFNFQRPDKGIYTPVGEDSKKGNKWMNMADIKYVDVSQLPKIPTGFRILDKSITGLLLGEVSLISGSNSSGKSSWLNQLSLNAINTGYKVALWSGELVGYRLKGWINQIAAGRSYVQKVDGYDTLYYAPKNISDRIDNWTKGKLFLYNNQYGSRWEQLMADITEIIEKEGVSLVIIDNLMAMSLEGFDGDNNSKQRQFILQVCDLAKKKNVHIIVVAHPRKQTDFLRKESISGSADLTNAVDNCFIIHRVNKDFETRGIEFFGSPRISEMMQYGNVVEICKNRSLGVVDTLCGMYYEIETRRFKNDIAEHIVYGWQEEPKPEPAFQPNDYEYSTYDFNVRQESDLPFDGEDNGCPF